jgi:hypothetical protein
MVPKARCWRRHGACVPPGRHPFAFTPSPALWCVAGPGEGPDPAADVTAPATQDVVGGVLPG